MAGRPQTYKDLTGRTFGHLTVLRDDGTRVQRKDGSVAVRWLCQCDCGKLTHAQTTHLLSGKTVSCGHVKRSNVEPGSNHVQSYLNKNVKWSTNTTGHRNISRVVRSGRERYRVAVMYQQKQHGGLRDTLEKALAFREELRKKYWPGYDD